MSTIKNPRNKPKFIPFSIENSFSDFVVRKSASIVVHERGAYGALAEMSLRRGAERCAVAELTGGRVKNHPVASSPERARHLARFRVDARETDPGHPVPVGPVVVDHAILGSASAVDRDGALVGARHVPEGHRVATILELEPRLARRRSDGITRRCESSGAEPPARISVGSSMLAIPREHVDVRGIEHGFAKATEDVGTEIPDQGGRLVGLVLDVHLGRGVAMSTVLDALAIATADELGIGSGNLPAARVGGIEPVFLAGLGPQRELQTLVVIGNIGDPKGAISLRLVTAQAATCAPVAKTRRASANLLDVAHRHLDALLGLRISEPGEETSLVVGSDGDGGAADIGKCQSARRRRIDAVVHHARVVREHALLSDGLVGPEDKDCLVRCAHPDGGACRVVAVDEGRAAKYPTLGHWVAREEPVVRPLRPRLCPVEQIVRGHGQCRCCPRGHAQRQHPSVDGVQANRRLCEVELRSRRR